MSNVPVFLFANLIINDEEQYREYEKGFFPILKKFVGEFITYDDNPITLEEPAPLQGGLFYSSFRRSKLQRIGILTLNTSRFPGLGVQVPRSNI